jgi:hypothetical protein
MKRIADKLVHAYYYELSMNNEDNEKSTSYYAVENNLKDFDFSQFESNKQITNWPDEAIVYVLGNIPSDFLRGTKIRIVSERFRQALEDFGIGKVQFFPIRAIHQESGKVVGNYWVLHAYFHVEALDWEHTVWRKMRGTDLEEEYPKEKYPFLYIMEPVLIWEKVRDVHVFQLTINGEPDISCPIYVSNEVRKELIRQGVNVGIYYIKVPAH